MSIELRPLTEADIAAHNAGEDAETVRWLSGGWATEETTRRHFAELAANAARGAGKRGFGVWLDGSLAGYVDFDPDCDDVPEPGDVNISYAVHPWARGRGVATAAVAAVCEVIARERVGRRVIIRAEPRNAPSVAVAERSGFTFLSEAVSVTDRDEDGQPVVFRVYALDLPQGR
ncbi:MAG: GNAT family N-acetyltransferase [Arachnia sp.]